MNYFIFNSKSYRYNITFIDVHLTQLLTSDVFVKTLYNLPKKAKRRPNILAEIKHSFAVGIMLVYRAVLSIINIFNTQL